MKLDEWDTLDDYLLKHIEAEALAQHSWEDGLLHISDLTGCPRLAALRLEGAEKRPLSKPERRKKAYMFYVANYLHELVYASWARAGILVEKECSIRGYVPKGWTGRFDAIINWKGALRLADVKTVAYLAKTASYPYPKHAAQVSMYDYFVGEDWGLTGEPIVDYIQRDLAHPEGIEVPVPQSDAARFVYREEMVMLDTMREQLPDLPPVLPRTMQFSGRKKQGQYPKVVLALDKRCHTDWCDYSAHTCTPDYGSDDIANWAAGDWQLTDLGEEMEDEFDEFLRGEEMDGL